MPYPDPCRQRRLTLSLVRRTVVAAELVSQTEPRQPSSPIGRACRPSDEFDADGRASLRKLFRPGQGLSPARANSHLRSAHVSHLAGLDLSLSPIKPHLLCLFSTSPGLAAPHRTVQLRRSQGAPVTTRKQAKSPSQRYQLLLQPIPLVPTVPAATAAGTFGLDLWPVF